MYPYLSSYFLVDFFLTLDPSTNLIIFVVSLTVFIITAKIQNDLKNIEEKEQKKGESEHD